MEAQPHLNSNMVANDHLATGLGRGSHAGGRNNSIFAHTGFYLINQTSCIQNIKKDEKEGKERAEEEEREDEEEELMR